MSNIIKSFEDAFARSKYKNWDRIYVLVDLHGTIFKPSYHNTEKYEYYPWAKETLQLMYNYKHENTRIILILWTSTTYADTIKYMIEMKKAGIDFEYINENPEIEALSTDPKSSCFDNKFYFNVGLDDKFGFDPEHDWQEIYRFLYNKING